MKNPSTQRGFTLVELAIVLVIIGLLIAGVLRGQEMLQNYRVDGTIQQVKAYSGATATFREAYSAFPGDFILASDRIPGCESTNSNGCVSGNGDGIIGAQNPGQGAYANEPWQSVTNTIASENTQFWKHLAITHLISGIKPSAQTPEWGASHPMAKLDGGFFVRYSNLNNGIQFSSHYLVLRNNIDGLWRCGGAYVAGYCVISGRVASHLDRKMDDGNATTGGVIAVSNGWASGCGGANAGTQGANGYDETKSVPTCDMMFSFP